MKPGLGRVVGGLLSVAVLFSSMDLSAFAYSDEDNNEIIFMEESPEDASVDLFEDESLDPSEDASLDEDLPEESELSLDDILEEEPSDAEEEIILSDDPGDSLPSSEKNNSSVEAYDYGSEDEYALQAGGFRGRGVDHTIYDNLLENRSFVEETFINDESSSDNPYFTSGTQYLYQDVMDTYQNKDFWEYKAMVDLYYSIDNIMDGVSEQIENLREKYIDYLYEKYRDDFGTEADWDKFKEEQWEKFKSGVTVKNYEAVLSKSLSTDYTSSIGDSVNNESARLQEYRTAISYAKKLKGAMSDAKEWASLASDLEDAEQKYYLYVALPTYADSKVEYWNTISDLLNGKKINCVTKDDSMTLAQALEADEYALLGSDNDKFLAWRTNLDLNIGGEKTKKRLSAGDVLGIVTDSMQNVLVIESLFEQQDSLVYPLRATHDIAIAKNDNKYAGVSGRYIKLLGSDYNYEENVNKAVYDAAMKFANSYIQKEIKKEIKKQGKNWIVNALSSRTAINSASREITAIKAAGYLEQLGYIDATIKLGMKLNSVADAADKIIEIKYLKIVKGYAVQAYKDDKTAYINAKNSGINDDRLDELAKHCLDDLFFIKKLTLRANELGYNTIKAIAESGLGRVIDWVGGTDTVSGLTDRYNSMQDSLIDTVLMPIFDNPFTVNSGETLTIQKDGSNYVGIYASKKGTFRIPEFEYRIVNGIRLNGGTLSVLTYDSQEIYTSYLYGNGKVVLPGSGVFAVGAIVPNGSLTISAPASEQTAKMVVMGDLYLNTSCFTIEDARVEVEGNLLINANE
ncbi:hypothetical protein, partial [Butyrivibrio sp. MC2021]|uniref:hypothetical protein n=1 Tax=Butyrivibrio sp. MC2021 TaxID=1408306 RepID=UPI00047938AF